MLNWIAVWVGAYLFELDGPLQNSDPTQQSVPVSNDVAASAKLPGLLGRPGAAGAAHRDLHRARGGRRLLGAPQPLDHRLRGAGGRLQPRGRPLRRHQRRAQLHPGHGRVRRLRRARGLGGLLGWQFHIATNDILNSANVGLGFFGIAVALLGRNTASGTVVAALLFGALLTGTSQRNLDPTIFEPELAANLTLIIQGLVVLIVSADVIVADDAAPRARDLPPHARRPAAPAAPAGRRRRRPREHRRRHLSARAPAGAPRRLGRHRAGLRRLVHHAAAGAAAHPGAVDPHRRCWR